MLNWRLPIKKQNVKSELINDTIFLLVIHYRGFAQKESSKHTCQLNCFEEAALFMRGMKKNSETTVI